jgi:hypothetical protein
MKAPGAERRVLLAALTLLGLGGLILHLRIHPFAVPAAGVPGGTTLHWALLTATLFPLLDVILVTALFCLRRTAVYGYVLNGFLAIYGAILMGHFSLADLLARSAPPFDWVLRSTFPDILILGADFLVGKLLWEAWLREPAAG